MTIEPSKPRRIELILRQIDALPTLPSIATRLLGLTSSDSSHAREVVELIQADPPLTAKVLSLCRTADRGVRDETLTIERAVVLLGFTVIRNAVLSVKVFELFDEHRPVRPGSDSPSGPAEFDYQGFWLHSLAVGILAESIAKHHGPDPELKPEEAFVCGLLHDVGKIALDHVLPKSFARVVELVSVNHGNIAEFERRVVGIDHHTAGKRLAEQWRLPHRLQDCIWLHGSPYDTLPKLAHRRLVGLINLADLVARRQHIGYSGNYNIAADPLVLAEKLDIRPEAVEAATAELHEQLEARARALGLHDAPTRDLFLGSIQSANQALGQLNQALELRSRTAQSQAKLLDAITAFHAAAAPGASVQDILETVIDSARNVFGHGFYATLYPADPTGERRPTWMISQYSEDGAPQRAQYIEAPPHAPDLHSLNPQQPGLNLMGILPWITDYLVDALDMRSVQLLPLNCGWGTAAILLHDRPALPPWKLLSALTSTWGAAVAAAAQHDGARRLGEELAEANTALAEAQDRLLRQESMARLGEMAAGAAHEMNNPLAVISGRSQLLSTTLPGGSKEQQTAKTIERAAHRLSDLISALHSFADPPQPQRRPVDLAAVLNQAIEQARTTLSARDTPPDISLKLRDQLPTAQMDAEQLCKAMFELISNATQAAPGGAVQVVAHLEASGESVVIQVIDDGDGMDEHTLAHALDPFFSARAAGRRVGMGLPRAQQLITGHGGTLNLRSAPGKGTTATVRLPVGPRLHLPNFDSLADEAA